MTIALSVQTVVPPLAHPKTKPFYKSIEQRIQITRPFREDVLWYADHDQDYRRPFRRPVSVVFGDLKGSTEDEIFPRECMFREETAAYVIAALLSDAGTHMEKYFPKDAYSLFPFLNGTAYVWRSPQSRQWMVGREKKGKCWREGARLYGTKPTMST